MGQFFSQYFLPTAIASIVATVLSVYTALNAQRDKERTFNTSFEGLVTSTPIMGAFKGSDTDEQKAASQLLALQAVADTPAQRRTVLLIAARLLNANTDSEATGAAAARLLNILIAEDLRGGDKQLRSLIQSQQFIDLVTAGYTNDYYNDDTVHRDWVTWSTLNGDQPISHDAKLAVLAQLSPSNFDGWVHVATFSSGYHFPNQSNATPAPSAPPLLVQTEKSQASIGQQTAESFLAAINEVNRDRSMRRAHALIAQYAIEPPTAQNAVAAPSPTAPGNAPPSLRPLPLLRATDLIDENVLPAKLVMLKPRLLRNRAPLEFVNPDGSFHKGSLGKIVGALPAGTCIDVVDPLHPVLVFVTGPMAAHVAGAATSEWTGLIHMWAHVKLSQGCGAVSVDPHAPDRP
ncbi:MAG: hypothetical protein QOF71_3066 [Candidatus Eremiobacteraeota bacterium]|nr:hypothetical protein [Candidatus Eremiobacteraeota bacterium]